jgi:hypothetical protein
MNLRTYIFLQLSSRFMNIKKLLQIAHFLSSQKANYFPKIHHCHIYCIVRIQILVECAQSLRYTRIIRKPFSNNGRHATSDEEEREGSLEAMAFPCLNYHPCCRRLDKAHPSFPAITATAPGSPSPKAHPCCRQGLDDP